MCDAAEGGRWTLMDRVSGVLVPDKQSKGESGRERMGVLIELEEWGRDEERERKRRSE